MPLCPGSRVTLLIPLPAHDLPMGATGQVVRIFNGWLGCPLGGVRFFQWRTAGWVVVRGVDPATVREASK